MPYKLSLSKGITRLWLDRLFGVVPYQPYTVAVAFFAPQLLANSRSSALEDHRRWPHVRCIAQWIVRIVVAGDYDDSIPRAGKLRNEISHRKLPFGSIRSKGILLYFIAFEMDENVILDLLMIGAADRAAARKRQFLSHIALLARR